MVFTLPLPHPLVLISLSLSLSLSLQPFHAIKIKDGSRTFC